MTREEYVDKSGELDDDDNRLFKNTDSNGRFHSDWCSMMYSRLLLARNLLTEDGAIFISMGDEEIENLKKICNEVFGDNNFLANLIWQSTPGSNTGENVKIVTENILLYCKNKSVCRFINRKIEDIDKYSNKDEYYEKRGGFVLNKLDRRMTGSHYSEALNYPIKMPDNTELYPGNLSEKQEHWNWRWSADKVKWGFDNGFLVTKKTKDGWSVYFKQYEKVNNEDIEIIRTRSYQNLLNIKGANSARGTRDVMSLFGEKLFDYPKPLGLMTFIQKMILKSDDIVLDFFSGSATTAHAVMQLNAEDGGHRKFIMVQLPEPCGEKTAAYKAGYPTICELGKERIRRAGEKIKEEHPDVATDLDVGFRVLKLDDSNMKDVYYSADALNQANLFDMVSNIKEDRNDLDLLFGCVLDWGLPLSLPYHSETIDGCTVHTYNDGDLVACFDEHVPESVVTAIAKRMPLRAVFRDASFANSADKINVFEIFKRYMPESANEITKRVKVI